MYRDTNPRYWEEYTNLQKVKHDLIREYLNGWFPKLSRWSGRVVYFDTHAGRGTHATGDLGSPLIALTTFLQHSFRDRILQDCEVVFYFIERDDENRKALEDEIRQVGSLPKNVVIETEAEDSFDVMQKIVGKLRQEGQILAPALIFIDPYGFKVPGRLLRDLMSFPRVEIFINVIWRELDMAIAQGKKQIEQRSPGGIADALNKIFDGLPWHERIISNESDNRADQTVRIFRDMVNAKWPTYIKMLGYNKATRYLLLHLSNHDAGRDLMKECMWKVCPDGGYYARKIDNPDQLTLITPEPDLTPLRHWLIRILTSRSIKYNDLIERLREEPWLKTQLNKVIRELRNDGRILADTGGRRFAFSNNPLLSFP